MAELINRVAKSGLVTINLESLYPEQDIVVFDLKDYLFMELILKEKEFRAKLKEFDWNIYKDKIVLIQCSADAIIPLWTYMLITQHLHNFAYSSYVGDKHAFLTHFYSNQISDMDIDEYKDKKIVIKGCSNLDVPSGAYQLLTEALLPIASSIMFGEPCSTVPIYKRPK